MVTCDTSNLQRVLDMLVLLNDIVSQNPENLVSRHSVVDFKRLIHIEAVVAHFFVVLLDLNYFPILDDSLGSKFESPVVRDLLDGDVALSQELVHIRLHVVLVSVYKVEDLVRNGEQTVTDFGGDISHVLIFEFLDSVVLVEGFDKTDETRGFPVVRVVGVEITPVLCLIVCVKDEVGIRVLESCQVGLELAVLFLVFLSLTRVFLIVLSFRCSLYLSVHLTKLSLHFRRVRGVDFVDKAIVEVVALIEIVEDDPLHDLLQLDVVRAQSLGFPNALDFSQIDLKQQVEVVFLDHERNRVREQTV